MKVLFVFPKWTGEYGIFSIFAKRGAVYQPLNLAMLAAIAEAHGHEAAIIDAQAEDLDLDAVIQRVEAFAPDVIGLTATTPFFHVVGSCAKRLKEKFPTIPLLLGGPHITILKQEAFEPCFDYAFIGEAEESFPAFLDACASGADISEIKGIILRKDGETVFTGQALPVEDLDSLPIPARHLLDMDKYMLGSLKTGLKHFTPIMTIRGCPFNCIFCSTDVFGRKVRKRSPSLVVEEIKEVVKRYGTRHFMFLDDTLTLDKKHILSICEMIRQEGLDITFEGSTRANLVDEEIVAALAQAGMVRISFGLESADMRVRELMRKGVPLEAYEKANRLTNKYGIETLNSCMLGLPGETMDSIKRTLSYLRWSKEIKQANISIAVPYPGTELYRMSLTGEHGLELLKKDFSSFRRYNSAVMRVGGFSPEDLIKLQNDAFASIYLAPWRWKAMYKKSGALGCLLTLNRLLKSLFAGRFELLFIDKNFWRKPAHASGAGPA